MTTGLISNNSLSRPVNSMSVRSLALNVYASQYSSSHCHTASEPAETLPLFRAIIHECHRCLLVHPDPSVLFFPPDSQPQEHATRSSAPFSRHSWVYLLIFELKGYLTHDSRLVLPSNGNIPHTQPRFAPPSTPCWAQLSFSLEI